MFTGLIDHIATIRQIDRLQAGIRLHVESHFSTLQEGESIAIDGACLTATEINGSNFQVELSTETVRLTLAKQYQVGHPLNVERALKLNDRLGGHFVTGHVDQTARIKSVTSQGRFTTLVITDIMPTNLCYLVSKGSLCVNGVSLTINHIENNDCCFMLVPHTLARTTFSEIKKNALVNLEFDLLAKIVVKQTRGHHHEQRI